MYRPATRRSAPRIALSCALVGALLSGCSGLCTNFARFSAGRPQANAEQRQQQAIAAAEAAVLAAPRDAALRARLGTTYLSAGRFRSAATSFADATALGDATPATALRLALALIGSGREGEAADLLFDRADELPAADLGLALAMTGEVGPAIRTLESALRDGENDVALRQNLALAYAFAGRWREARLMAALDVPAGRLGERMEKWAALVTASGSQQRLAMMLRLPGGAVDGGLPIELALAPAAGRTPVQAAAVRAAASMASALPALTAASVASDVPPDAQPVRLILSSTDADPRTSIVTQPIAPIAAAPSVAAPLEHDGIPAASRSPLPRIVEVARAPEMTRTISAYVRRQNRSGGARW